MATGQLNAGLYTNNDGLRLITEYEGAPRLKARLCEGNSWELSYGVTFYPDGRPVREGETCTEADAMVMFRHALETFEEAVRNAVTTQLDSNQFSALVALCYNIGEENFGKSTVLRETNARRFYDAAAAFGMWLFATKNGYKQALRGLLRRRYSEACLFLGYDWTEACANDAIALQRQKPETLPGADRVIYKTPFADVLAVAQHYPLMDELLLSNKLDQPAAPSAAEAKEDAAASPQPAPSASSPIESAPNVALSGPGAGKAEEPEKAAPTASTAPPLTPSSAPASSPVGAGKAAEAKPVAPRPQPLPPILEKTGYPPVVAGQDDAKPIHRETKFPDGIPYGIDPTAGAKPMESTERFVGAAMMWVANALRVGSANGLKLTGPLGMIGVLFLEMMKTPATAAIMLSTFVAIICGFFWLCGFTLEKAGLRKKKRGERHASQLMY